MLQNFKNIFKFQSLYNLIIYATGIFATMPIVTLKLGGRHVSAFTLSFSIFMLYLALEAFYSIGPIQMGKMTRAFGGWLAIALISSIFGLFYFDSMPSWFTAALSHIPKILLFIVLLLLVISSDYKEQILYKLLKGILIGCILNLIWTSMDGLSFYINGYSLNNKVFAEFARMNLPERPYISIIHSSGIRSTGFNYDPAHLGGIIPITMLYGALRKNYYLMVLSLLAVVFSQSTTSLVSSVVLLALNVGKIKNSWPQIFTANFLKGMAVVTSVMLCVGFLTRNMFLFQIFLQNLTGFTNRISSVYISGKIPNIRLQYILYIPYSIVFSGVKIFTGTGFGTSSYPYVFSDRINYAMALGKPWAYDPENTYINYLFDTGIFGFFLYLFIIITLFSYLRNRVEKKEEILLYSAMGGIIVSGLFYHYVLTAYHVLLLISAVVLTDLKHQWEKELV